LGGSHCTTTYLINMLLSTILQLKSPMEAFLLFYPHINHSFSLTPKKIGCVSFVHIHKQQGENLIQGHLNVFY